MPTKCTFEGFVCSCELKTSIADRACPRNYRLYNSLTSHRLEVGSLVALVCTKLII